MSIMDEHTLEIMDPNEQNKQGAYTYTTRQSNSIRTSSWFVTGVAELATGTTVPLEHELPITADRRKERDNY